MISMHYFYISLLRDFFPLLPEGEADAQCHNINYFDPASKLLFWHWKEEQDQQKKDNFITPFHYDKNIFLQDFHGGSDWANLTSTCCEN